MFLIGLGPNSHVPCNRASAPNPPCWIRSNQAGFISVLNQLNVLVLWGFFFSRVRKNRSSPLILQNSSKERRFLSASMSRSLCSRCLTPVLRLSDTLVDGEWEDGRLAAIYNPPPLCHSATHFPTLPPTSRPTPWVTGGGRRGVSTKFAQVFLLCCRVQNFTAVHLDLCPLAKCAAFQAAF